MIGSVFLGDVQRHRLLSGSTPPSSPPPPSLSPSSTAAQPFPSEVYESPKQSPATIPPPPPPTIEPVQSLELRLRWLEALLYGVKPEKTVNHHRRGSPGTHDKAHGLKNGETLVRSTEELQRKLNAVVEGNDGLRRFMSHYEQHASLLTPAFALSGTLPASPPAYQNMSPSELEAFLAELEPDIRAADRDMREIEMLEKKGVTGAGKLPDYEALQPRLEALLQKHREDLELASALETRIAALMRNYANQVDALSELFVEWDGTLRDAEDKVTLLERDREERIRLGYE